VHGTRVKAPGELCGHARAFGAARIDVLWPCPSYDAGYDPNDNSLVLRVRYGAHTFLFTGDIEAHAEQALLASGVDLHADVLKVAHHGSHTSSSAAFLRAVSPRLAVISAGAVNRFGHPHADVVQRLQAVAQTVVDLGKTGGVIVRSDGHDLSLAGNDLERTVRSCALPQMTPLTSERRPASPSSDRGSP
jgi:competence protein ComEC